MRPDLATRCRDFRPRSRNRFNVKPVTGFDMRMHTIGRKDRRLCRRILWLRCFENQFACGLKPGHLDTKMDRRNPVTIGQFLHRAGSSRHFSGLQVTKHPLSQRVDVADVGFRICFPRLANDSFHRFVNPFGRCAAVVYSELNKQQVRLVLQHVALQAKNAKV